eukprot:m.69315 g.69315  ORF g.69315 m.69315 type:complete len:383 (-) comp24076_c0_seq3:169-1317(-)
MATPKEKAEMLKAARMRMEDKKPDSELKHIKDLKGETVTYDKTHLPNHAILHFQDDVDCTFTVAEGTTIIKLLVENCTNCTVILPSGCNIVTSTVEIWKCTNLTMSTHITIGTIQLDMCTGIHIEFDKVEGLTQMIQAGVHDMTVKFQDSPKLDYETGMSQLQKTIPDLQLDDAYTQFITRYIDGAVLVEEVVRTANDFPTTQREHEEHMVQQKLKEEGLHKMAHDMLHGVSSLDTSDKSKLKAELKKSKVDDTPQLGPEARAEYRRSLGNEQFKIQEFQQAAVHYTESIELYPGNPAVWCNRSMCWLKLANPTRALADADECIKIDPNYVKAHFRRGAALLTQEKYVDACLAFRKTLDLDPKNAPARSSMMLAEKKMSMMK